LSGKQRTPFRASEARAAIWEAKGELLLPVVVLAGIFSGFTTLVEAAALTVAIAFILEFVAHRKLGLRRDLPRIGVECAIMVGGFMIILGVALGFTNYLIDAEIPMRALALIQEHIESPYLFLLVLNLFLLVVGGLMDIYSAIFVVVPLIVPIAAHYGIHPVHLGIIFLANLELGYLTPPIGQNLFLASYRFDRPLPVLFRSIVPFRGSAADHVRATAHPDAGTPAGRLTGELALNECLATLAEGAARVTGSCIGITDEMDNARLEPSPHPGPGDHRLRRLRRPAVAGRDGVRSAARYGGVRSAARYGASDHPGSRYARSNKEPVLGRVRRAGPLLAGRGEDHQLPA
jgi:hypothetical protein